MTDNWAVIKSAYRRAKTLGRYHCFTSSFNSHYLAACLDNYTAMLDNELGEDKPDYIFCLYCLLKMSERINAFCDSNKVSEDIAGQYWLERFLWRIDSVMSFEVYVGEVKSSRWYCKTRTLI